MVHRILFFYLLCATTQLVAQTTGFDLRVGTGTYFAGSGDMRGLMVENELNYTLNPKFAVSGQLGFGRSDTGLNESSAFFEGNATIFWSPFSNDVVNDFRLGAGLGYHSVSDSYLSSSQFSNGQLVDEDYTFDNRSATGYNAVVENTYALTERLLLGGKLFLQNYGGDVNTGLLIKLGIRL